MINFIVKVSISHIISFVKCEVLVFSLTNVEEFCIIIRKKSKRRKRKLSVTLKDIARELNISVNAVSRALRNMPDIGKDTTVLVQETAKRLGYRKNLAASYLKTSKSMTLGIVIPDICNPVFSYIYKGIEKVCSETNYALMLGNSNENPQEEKAMISNMIAHGVDGVFVVPSNSSTSRYTALQNAGIPYIFLQRRAKRAESSFVHTNDCIGGYLAAKHLYELGHRRFLLVFPTMEISSAKERYEGFVRYLSKMGLDESAVSVLECDSTRIDGYNAMSEWLKNEDFKKKGITAVFCFSDYVAYGVYSAISERGYNVPKDLSLIGYDNNEYSDIISPSLTTVDILPYEIGNNAARIMLDMIKARAEGKEKKIVEFEIPPTLIDRKSTKKLI